MIKQLLPSFLLLVALPLPVSPVYAETAHLHKHEEHDHDDHDHRHHEEDEHGKISDLHPGAPPIADPLENAVDWKPEGVFHPEVFLLGVFGDSTANPADLASGDHDPATSADLQSLHVAGFFNWNDRITGFANYDAGTDANGKYGGNLEEAFLHYRVYDGLQVGGGQFLNSFGFQNERHVHAWDFVDQYLVNGRMLNEGELTTIGGEVIIDLPWHSTLTLGGGGLSSHEHGEHEDEHHDHAGAEFESELANFDDWVVSGNFRSHYSRGLKNMAGTASFAIGENGFGETTQVYGLGHEILCLSTRRAPKEVVTAPAAQGFNGFGAGSFRWRTEAMIRRIEAVGSHEEEPGHEEEGEDHHEEGERRADFDEFGIYTMLQYGLCDWAYAGFRAEWISGIDGLELDERWRLSPALTGYLNPAHTLQARLQYNYDHSNDFGSEHSVWFQIGMLWGGAPGHHGHEH